MFFSIQKDTRISGRYITYSDIEPILQDYITWKCQEGLSVLKNPIPLYNIGNGSKKILIWSQMHGNESTTTKAIIDIMKYCKEFSPNFLNHCTLYIIPMLNPDGAKQYTRLNANGVDLNRDAQNLTQPESQFLRNIFDSLQPDFCFNLHDQRSIFNVGMTNKPATISFLAPSADESRKITLTRQKSMEIISVMNNHLQKLIPEQIGRFDDSFNINCTGDMFTNLGVPTILFEAGHFQNDYSREQTRKYISESILKGIEYISENIIKGENFKKYFIIPENNKLFCDIFIQNDINPNENIAIFYQETLINNKICFKPEIIGEGLLKNTYGHLKILLSNIYTNENYNFDFVKKYILHFISDNMKNIVKF